MMITRPLIAILAALTCSNGRPAHSWPARPNVIIILADDLGFSDVGCYGGEIQTPHLDRLAAGGLRFTQFYNTARCWPSRAALLTGYYAQQVRRDTISGVPSGARGERPGWARLLPELLRPFGYRSYHSGKWHIDGKPLANGFDRSYHVEDIGRHFHPRVLFEDDRELPPVELGTRYYTTTAIADHGINYLGEHAAQYRDQPFLLYIAFGAPHFPLQAPPEDIATHVGRYREGWDVTRAERWKRIQKMGLVRGRLSDVESDVGPPYHFADVLAAFGAGEVSRPLPWNTLSDGQRVFQAVKMSIHAAMIDRMDREVGRLIDQIRVMGAFENTLILFLSDNGASAEMMIRDDGHDPKAPAGSAGTHLCLGPGWSTVANTPFRRHKPWVHEGGIATPLIVHWPEGIPARDELRHDAGHVIDIVPTILEVTGANHQQTADTRSIPASPGKSLVPAFARDGSLKHNDLWWEHEGNRAIRVGDWKLVAAKDSPWELYDLATDRTETRDLAAENPAKVLQLSKQWTNRWNEFIALAHADQKTGQATGSDKPVKELILPGESFVVAGRPAFILTPAPDKKRAPQPWIFYAPTLPGYLDAHEKWMHEQFIAAGVAVAGIDVGEAYGSPDGRRLFTDFYRELTEKRGFAPKPCLLGRSRGGLLVTSWAIENPDKVAGIAGIYPVFDLRTYPRLDRVAPAYNLTLAQLQAQLVALNPSERIGVLANDRVPAFLIHGDDDKVVPLKENSAEFVAKYRAAGAAEMVTLIVAKGQGHNFWEGFFRCRPLIEFAIDRAHAGALAIPRK
jgi:arylsulfatase A-like enzyme